MSIEQEDIVRFTSWAEIFPNTEEAEKEYRFLLEDMRDSFGDLVMESVEIDPDRGVEMTVFKDRKGRTSKVWRLDNGDVAYELDKPGQETRLRIIKPEVGSCEHDWTGDAVRQIRQKILELMYLPEGIAMVGLPGLGQALKGKLATAEWEAILSEEKGVPIRVGYRIYASRALERAQQVLGGLSK